MNYGDFSLGQFVPYPHVNHYNGGYITASGGTITQAFIQTPPPFEFVKEESNTEWLKRRVKEMRCALV